jgi:PhnB protein
MDMFWGDRFGQVQDPFGHVWSMATHKEDLSPEEMARRGEEAMAAMPPPKPARKKAASRPSQKRSASKKSVGKKRRR